MVWVHNGEDICKLAMAVIPHLSKVVLYCIVMEKTKRKTTRKVLRAVVVGSYCKISDNEILMTTDNDSKI